MSGDPVIYTNWYNATRTFDNEHQDCVVIGLGNFNGQWEDMSCHHTNGYICEFGRSNNNPYLVTDLHLTRLTLNALIDSRDCA